MALRQAASITLGVSLEARTCAELDLHRVGVPELLQAVDEEIAEAVEVLRVAAPAPEQREDLAPARHGEMPFFQASLRSSGWRSSSFR